MTRSLIEFMEQYRHEYIGKLYESLVERPNVGLKEINLGCLFVLSSAIQVFYIMWADLAFKVPPHLSVIMRQPPAEGLWAGGHAAWAGVGRPRARAAPGSGVARPWSRGGR